MLPEGSSDSLVRDIPSFLAEFASNSCCSSNLVQNPDSLTFFSVSEDGRASTSWPVLDAAGRFIAVPGVSNSGFGNAKPK